MQSGGAHEDEEKCSGMGRERKGIALFCEGVPG